ncbi:MAG: O-antigen ligase family protein [Actinobacteria bacterium]|nr:MAG: O-antigen ligase family protein [Actinomycetota bacterium]
MDSGDAAQLAAVAGALGAAFVLLAWSRIPLLAGLALLAGAEAGLVYDLSDHGHRISPKLVALGVAALVPMAVGAAVLVRWPTLITPVVLAAAPFRPPLSFGSEHRFYVGVAAAGQLGRLLPLYGVLGAAALALGWSALRGRELRPVHPLVSLPAVAFFALAALSLHWTLDPHAGENVLAYFLFPFAVLVAIVARAPFPPWLPRVLGVIAIALATLFAVVGLIQVATHKLWFFSPAVEVGNAYSSFFRVTSLFRDPSLYGRHVVLGLAILLVAVLFGRLSAFIAFPLAAIMFAGLWFSYSQSSMAALFVVTLALAFFAGKRVLRRVAVVTAAILVLAGAGLVLASISGHSARRVTSDRSRRIELTVKVIRDHPLVGVGLGSQPVASQARSSQGGSPTRFVSHTTPLTIAAELGLLGVAAYLALLLGAAALIRRVYRLEAPLGLGLGAVLLALLVHSLAYSGFFEDPITWFVLAVAAGFVFAREPATEDAAILGPSSAPARTQ